MTLDHIGIAISSPAQEALFEGLLVAAPYKAETVEREGVRTVFFGDGGVAGAAPKLELLDALAEDTPVGQFLARRGPGLHHLAFEVDDLDVEMARVRDLGIRLLADVPKAGADGKRIVFLHPKDTAGVLVELCQSVRTPPVCEDVPYGDTTLAVWTSGPEHAPPLVVLHGALGSTTLETDRLVRHWERDHRVLALDFEGHGASGDTGRVPDWAAFVDSVRTVCEAFDLQRAALFGFSMGGSVALAAAHALPDRFARVAVHAVNVQWTEDEVPPMVDPMDPVRMETEHPYWARRLRETHGERWQALVTRMIAFTRALPGDHISDALLGSLVQPVLVSAGDADRYFDLRHAVHLRRTIPNARLWVLPGLDHPIQGLDAASFARTVGAFLSA